MANSRVTHGAGKLADKLVQKDGTVNPMAAKAISKLLSVQRPIVLAYVRSVRRRHPHATPAQMADILADHYKNLVTGGGAATGATAVIPGLGTGAALGVAAIETGAFLEGSALYAQSIAEIHNLPVEDPARANALIMGLMLGNDGKDMVKKVAAQAQGEDVPRRDAAWGAMITKQIPTQMVDMLTKQMRKAMFKRYARRSAGSLIGRILPFGIGAVVGAAVNRKMAKIVIENAQHAFGPAPAVFEPELEPKVSTQKRDTDIMGGLKQLLKATKKKRRGGNDDVIEGEVVERSASSGSSSFDGEPQVRDDTPRTYRPDVRL
ncbi:hypothetical protein HMPREF0183_1313 [Brevibacterium mcbrellneri ATCC 49030]|uniref:Tat pathway signal sequence domain protein n=1 Tax=Brevibacterium mcbrellneri ATCC 49030 TaxID=585530 RepID=D4YN04_9MICO|nr:hypothetical protein [Brevibacterium mcbrellneri]EFG47322.1 hypothetical protein HMPREF0183_1313 [Brevibacterium mcbrellneri ATCC 49030]